VGFKRENPKEKVVPYNICVTWVPVEKGVCQWVCSRDSCVCLEKCVDLCHTTKKTLLGLSIVVLLSVGHYAYYMIPNFSIIKSFSTLVFPMGFSKGIYPKILAFMFA